VSLHKWLLAPNGTGLLFVKRDMIDKFWPLQAAPATSTTDIRKFEEIGTAPAAIKAGIADALAFHQAIGAERKAARLYYLTMRWANAVRTLPRIRMHSSLKPGETWGLAAVGIDGMEPAKMTSFLWDKCPDRVMACRAASLQLRRDGRAFADAERLHDDRRNRYTHRAMRRLVKL
jgi:selenocysteine lyase/cysteine desulfurase